MTETWEAVQKQNVGLFGCITVSVPYTHTLPHMQSIAEVEAHSILLVSEPCIERTAVDSREAAVDMSSLSNLHKLRYK